MALDFPSGAIVGTVYTGTNGAVYTFDGIKWRISSQTLDIIPSTNDLYNLGSTSSIWNNLFVGSAFIKDTTSATSTNTGALQVTGGVGIGGSLYVGGPVYSQGIRLTGNEIDPVFTASSAVSITATNITNWNTAYGWGNHATRGYLTATVSSHLLPGANSLYDLGSTSSQWRSLYVSTNTIYIGGNALSVIDGNLSLNGSSAAGLGQFKISGNNLGTVDNPNTGGWGGYDMYIDPGNGSNAFIYIPGVPNQSTSTNLQISNNSTAGAIQLFGRGGVQVVVNHGVNEKVFEFADNGSLIFPDGTTATTAFTGNAVTVDIMNTNGIDYNYYITFVENRSATQDLRADVDLTFNSWSNTLGVGKISVNSIDGSTSTITGALTVAGGVGIQGDLYAGNIYTNGVQLTAVGGGTNVTNVFMYNSNASYSMTQNVEYKIPFDTTTTGHDAGDFQTTSSQFIPQIAGWYLLETHLNFGGVWSGNVNVSVYKNNNQERLIGTSWIGNGGGVGGSTFVYSNGSTDIFEIRATQTSGGVQALEHGATKTWFQATWMKS